MAEVTLVTGAFGMIGHAVLDRLSAAGRPVVAMDREPPPDDPPWPWAIADIGDLDALQATVTSHGIEHVVHCAAISGPMVAADDPSRVFRINVEGTRSVLEACRRTAVRRVLFTSSVMAYGNQTGAGPVDEARPLLARDPYGASKVCGEAMLRAYAGCSDFTATALRIAMVYGPRRRTSCLIGETLRAARRGEPHAVAFGRGWSRQYIHVDDVVEGIVAALDHPKLPQDAYNIAPGRQYPLEEIATALAREVPGAALELGGDGHPFDPEIGVLDIAAARRDFDFHPKVSLEQGIRDYAVWLDGHEV